MVLVAHHSLHRNLLGLFGEGVGGLGEGGDDVDDLGLDEGGDAGLLAEAEELGGDG